MLGKHARYEIVEAIREAERGTRGEIRVHVKGRCKDAMKEAKRQFFKLRMQRTKERNGVLIFVALQSRHFAIVGDQAMHAKVGEDFWNAARDAMQAHFEKNELVTGIVAGVRRVGEKLKQHFPAAENNPNELPDKVSGSRCR